jgi:hypothetical protein
VLLLVAGCSGPDLAPEAVFHRDPATVREHYQPWLLFAHLGETLESVASAEFERSLEDISAVRVEWAHIPSGVVELARRYVQLCEELTRIIADIFEALDEADRMLEENNLASTGQALEDCRRLLPEAKELLQALEDATSEVFAVLRRTGGGGTTAQLAEARASLDAALALLLELTEAYEQRVAAIEEQVVGKAALPQPTVIAQLDPEAAWVGEMVAVAGTVRVDGKPLGGREVQLCLDEKVVGVAQIDDAGAFQFRLKLPHEYVPKRVITVAYVPSGGDLSRLLPSMPVDLPVTVRYHNSGIEASSASRVYPGLAAHIEGVVASSGTIGERPVEVRWRGHIMCETATDSTGVFQCSFVLPAEAATGRDEMRLAVPSDDLSATAPAASTVDVDITRLAPQLDIQVPRVLIVPNLSFGLPRRVLEGRCVTLVTVDGQLKSSLPLSNALVSADWGGEPVRWQQDAGSFQNRVPLGMSIWATGIRTVTVRVLPHEPWHRGTEAHAQVIAVNLLIPIVWTLVIVLALILGLALRRFWPLSVRPESVISPAATVGTQSVVASGVSVSVDPRYKGARLQLVRLYYRAVIFLQSTSGVGLRRDMTVREYRSLVSGLVPTVAGAFSRLTALVEKALYDEQEPGRGDVAIGRESLEAVAPPQSDDHEFSAEEAPQ